MKLLDGVKGDAVVSTDQRYRYALTRDWFPKERGSVLWIMLNPSTGSAHEDDRTLRRCQSFSRAWGFDGITVVNLYAYRTAYPKELGQVVDPVGPSNNEILEALFDAKGIGMVVAAWGSHRMTQGRGATVRARAARVGRTVHALKLTKDGHPWHPLYVPAETEPIVWRPDEAREL